MWREAKEDPTWGFEKTDRERRLVTHRMNARIAAKNFMNVVLKLQRVGAEGAAESFESVESFFESTLPLAAPE